MTTRTWRRPVYLLLAVVAVTAAAVAYGCNGRQPEPVPPVATVAADVWTCPMHPDVREQAPGRCPKCGMDLERETAPASTARHDHPAAADNAEIPRADVQLDTRRRQLLGVRTVPVDRTSLDREIRAVGVVRYDETRLADVNLKLDGWVTKLHVDYTGQPVTRGQPLLEFYSPELLATENEYLLALSTRDSLLQSQVADARTQADRLVESARQRLALWDLPADHVQRLEKSRKADGNVTFRAPVGGFVIEKPVVEGMRVMAGQTLYKIVDLSTVWVEADVYESDAPFLKPGAPASVTIDAWPGESLQGKAVYIYPFVEEKTRTLKVRFAFPNRRQRLKPGMYANVALRATLGTGLTIPADALLDAGRQQLVFVSTGEGYYQPRKVQAGQRLGDRVQILDGLEAGERVATGASFFLDSESQLRAAAGGWEEQKADTAGAAAGNGLAITLSTTPDPPRNGENEFSVVVKNAAGAAVEDAQVKVVLYMPAMPSMNMPAMTSEATLAHGGGGTYRGKGMVSMAGRWDVTVTVSRGSDRLGTRQTSIVAR